MTKKTLNPIYSQPEALFRMLEVAENAKDLELMFSIILNYCKAAENENSDSPIIDAVKKYLKDCNFETLTEQTKEQIGLDIDVDYYV